MKVEKAQGERKVKTRERDNERVIYAVSSSVVSLHYEKSVLRPKCQQGGLENTMTSEGGRDSNKVELIELGRDYPSVKVTWS